MAQANWFLSSWRPGLDHDPVLMREFWWAKLHRDRYFSEYFGCQYPSASPSYPAFIHLPLTLFNLSKFSFYASSQNWEERMLATSCLSVRVKQLGSYLRIFQKYFEKIQVLLKSDKNEGLLHMKTNIQFLSYLSHFFLEWEMFQTKVLEKIKTHILYSVTFF